MKFRVIVADPPWSYEDKLRMGGTIGIRRSADSHYDVMPLEEILALGDLISPLCEEACVLALWCPNTLLLSHGAPTIRAWGFQHKQVYTWVKSSKDGSPRPGMGRMFRNATESALVAVRGKPAGYITSLSQLNVDLHPWMGHSRKPERLQDRLECMFTGQAYLELFARRVRERWVCCGKEIDGKDIREDLTELAT